MGIEREVVNYRAESEAYETRAIMSYTELTVWTRGIIMDKEGRDIVNSVAASARLEGKFAQAMENYVDNPDRTNAPTRKYCRVSDERDRERAHLRERAAQHRRAGRGDDGQGVGLHARHAAGRHAGDQHALHAGLHDPLRAGPERLAQLVCVDAAKLADHKWLYYRLGELGLDRLSTEGAAERNKAIAPDIAAPLIAAVVKTTGIVKLETIEPMIANKSAFRAALDELHILPLEPVAA